MDYNIDKDMILGHPYVMTRLDGKSLWTLINEGLDTGQIASAVKQITHQTELIASVGAYAGGVISAEHLDTPFERSDCIHVDRFAVPTEAAPESWSTAEPFFSQSPFQWMHEQGILWFKYESTLKNVDNSHLWTKLLEIARELYRDNRTHQTTKKFSRGIARAKDIGEGFWLMHNDLEPRNIMAKIDESGEIKITGIVDWE